MSSPPPAVTGRAAATALQDHRSRRAGAENQCCSARSLAAAAVIDRGLVNADSRGMQSRRAAAAHQSLQEYLRARLIDEASEPTLDEVLDRAGGRAGGSVPLKAAVAAVRADRDRR